MRDRQVLPEGVEETLAEYKVDLICGGFPCVSVSEAGQRKGLSDKRWLWSEFRRIIGLLRPRLIIIENVTGLLEHGPAFAAILTDLASWGYDAEWNSLSTGFMFGHNRPRVFIIAYPMQQRLEGRIFTQKAWATFTILASGNRRLPTPRILGRVPRFPNRVDRLKALGNAVVPQIAEWIGRRITTQESERGQS